MTRRDNPFSPPRESDPSESSEEVPSSYSIPRLVSYSLAMLLGIAFLIGGSGVIDRLYSIDLDFPFRTFLWFGGFYTSIFSEQFVLCTKADRVATRKLARGRIANLGCKGAIVTVSVVVIITVLFFSGVDWLKLGLNAIADWSESENGTMVAAGCYLFASVMLTGRVFYHWKRWYFQAAEACQRTTRKR